MVSESALLPDNPPSVASVNPPNEKPLLVKFSVLYCKARGLAKISEPPVMLVVPLKLLAPLNISVPLPDLVRLPVVEALAPLMVSTEDALVTSIVDMVPGISVKALLVDAVVPVAVYCKVPPFKTKLPASAEACPRFPATPPALIVATLSVPAVRVVTPVKVFVPDRVRVPAPALVSESRLLALPSLITPEKVVFVEDVTVSVAEAPVLVMMPPPSSEPMLFELPPRSRVAPALTVMGALAPKAELDPAFSVAPLTVVPPV